MRSVIMKGNKGDILYFLHKENLYFRDLSRLIRITDAASKVVWTDYPLSEFAMS